VGWIALVALAVWRLPESPPWRLPLPIGLALLAFAAVLVLAALVWARMVDRRRRPRPGPAQTPPRVVRQPTPDRVAP
jgi:membrane protein implicated in regulation of membrane protease activity